MLAFATPCYSARNVPFSSQEFFIKFQLFIEHTYATLATVFIRKQTYRLVLNTKCFTLNIIHIYRLV